MSSLLPRINQELCNLCGLCVEACSCQSVEMGEHGPVFRCADDAMVQCVEESQCHCLCEEVCPTGALECSYEIVLEDRQDDSPACAAQRRMGSRPKET